LEARVGKLQIFARIATGQSFVKQIIPKKGGDGMKKYLVRICEPTVYEMEAENEHEAEEKALALYKKEKNTWLTPDVVEVGEVPAE